MRFTCLISSPSFFLFFFFNDTATTEIYTLSLHDALPICDIETGARGHCVAGDPGAGAADRVVGQRSEEHTSELQSRQYLVCRLLLEKKKKSARAATASTCPFLQMPQTVNSRPISCDRMTV